MADNDKTSLDFTQFAPEQLSGKTRVVLAAFSKITPDNPEDGTVELAALSRYIRQGALSGTLVYLQPSAPDSYAIESNAHWAETRHIRILADTSLAALTVDFPEAPEVGDLITISDIAGAFATNAVLADAGVYPINGQDSQVSLSLEGLSLSFIFIDAAMGWTAVESGSTVVVSQDTGTWVHNSIININEATYNVPASANKKQLVLDGTGIDLMEIVMPSTDYTVPGWSVELIVKVPPTQLAVRRIDTGDTVIGRLATARSVGPGSLGHVRCIGGNTFATNE